MHQWRASAALSPDSRICGPCISSSYLDHPLPHTTIPHTTIPHSTLKERSPRLSWKMVERVEEHQPSTSASTVRGLRHLDMAILPQPPHSQEREQMDTYLYHPPSPHSAYGQSEPGSPSGDSVSSFPSVSSSFLFSSGPASPPHPHSHSEAESELGDSTSGLVIPSLTLPLPSRRPTPYGQTLGELRLLLLGPKGTDTSVIASQLVDDNEDVVEVGIWEEKPRAGGSSARGKRKATLRASTHWVEHRDAHGLDRIEPARNVELVELPPYDPYAEVRTLSSIETRLESVPGRACVSSQSRPLHSRPRGLALVVSEMSGKWAGKRMPS